jgi:transposase
VHLVKAHTPTPSNGPCARSHSVERTPSLGSSPRAWFAGSNSGGKHWAIIATLIQSAKLNDVDPLAWLTDVLERIVSGRTKRHELDTLLPWNWKAAKAAEAHDTT